MSSYRLKQTHSKTSLLFWVFFALLLCQPLSAFAIVYQPGATLDPACLPTDINCTVTAPLTASSLSTFSLGGSLPAGSLFYVAGTSTLRDIIPDGNLLYSIGSPTNRLQNVYTNNLILGQASFIMEDIGGVLRFRDVNSAIPGLIIDPSSGATVNGSITVNGAISTLAATTSGAHHTGSLSVGNLSGLLWGTDGAVSAVATSTLGLLTTDIAEGSRLYFTQDRFDTALLATSSLQHLAVGTSTWALSAGTSTLAHTANTALTLSGFNQNNYLTFASWFATTTHTDISSLPSLSINENQIGNLTPYLALSSWYSTTTSALAEGSNLYFTTARAQNSLSSSALGLSYSTTTGIFSLSSGYNIPLTASTTNWATFRDTPSTRITAGTGLVWVGNALGSLYASATQDGIVSTTTQTFAGAKTFSTPPTFSTMNNGSIFFAGTGGLLNQDNGLYFDNTNKRLGIGSVAPNERLTVNGLVALGEQLQTTYADSTVGYGKIFVKGATGDGNDKYSILLAHFDGESGSTEFVDSSGQQVSLVANNGAVVTATTTRFGTGALFLNGTSQYVSAPTNLNYDFLNNTAYTIDVWFNASSTSGIRPLLTYGSTQAGNYWSLRVNAGQAEFIYRTTNQTRVNIIGGTVSTSTWYHLALVRSSAEGYGLFLNGTSLGTGSATNDSNFTGSLNIGADQSAAGSNYFAGAIDELRLSQGLARYSADFVPESSPYGTGLFYQLANGSLVEVQGGGAGGSGSSLDVNAFHKSGDAFGATSTIGTLDAYGLQFMTGGSVRAFFGTDGRLTVSGESTFVGTTTVGRFVAGEGMQLASSTPDVTSNSLYNQGGTLYWNGSAVGGELSGAEGQTVVFNSSGDPTATNALFVSSVGKVGVGTVSPSATLTIVGDMLLEGSSRYLNFGTTTGALGYGFRDKNGVLEFKNLTGGWTAMGTSTSVTASTTPLTGAEGSILTFDVFGDPVATSSIFLAGNGYFSIGTALPNNRLYVDGGITLASSTPNASSSALYNIGNTLYWNGTKVRQGDDVVGTEGYVMSFNTAGLQTATSTLFISPNGRVGIGTNSPQILLHLVRTTPGAVLRLQDSNAVCDISPTNGALNCSSDRTLKKNVATISDSLEAVLALDPITFDWNGEVDGSGNHLGFIAQDVEKLFPSLVFTDRASELKSINYTGFIPILTNAIQEITELGHSFKQRLIRWFADAANGIEKFFSREIYTEKICLTDDTGVTCFTRADMNAALSGVDSDTDTMYTKPQPEINPDPVPPEAVDESTPEPEPVPASEPEPAPEPAPAPAPESTPEPKNQTSDI